MRPHMPHMFWQHVKIYVRGCLLTAGLLLISFRPFWANVCCSITVEFVVLTGSSVDTAPSLEMVGG